MTSAFAPGSSFRAVSKPMNTVRVAERQGKYALLLRDLVMRIPQGECRFVAFSTQDKGLRRSIKTGIDTAVHGRYPGRFSIRMGEDGIVITEKSQ